MTEDALNKSADVTAEACAWIAQLETGALSSKDTAAFREWIERSPRHYAEIHRLARLSGEVNVIAEMAGPLSNAADSMKPIRRAHGSIFGRLSFAAVAAWALVLAVGAVVISELPMGSSSPYMLATEVGGFDEAELADKSLVTLNTNSQLEVDFDREERRVRLLEGEAYFDVAHDSEKPFVVYAGEQKVRAVGTAFTVRYERGKLSVVVSEGRVALARAAQLTDGVGSDRGPKSDPAGEAEGVELGAGQRAVVAEGDEIPLVEEIAGRDLQRALSWRSGLLDFDKAPLSAVVEELSRYTDLQIEIVDDELNDLQFGGLFRTGETQELFEALELSFGVEVERLGDSRVLLRRSAG